MERLLGRVSPILHLTRVTTAFAAVSNVWFVILYTAMSPDEFHPAAYAKHPLWLLLLGGTASALGLYAFATSMNDILDIRRDRSLHPDRPLAKGSITPETASVVVAFSLIIAVLGSTVFGLPSTLLTLGLTLAILFFNGAARFVPGFGLVLLGLIYAGHMLVPNPGLRFLWPVWLVMTHALLVAAFTHILARKVPPLSGRAMIMAGVGWVVWSGLILIIGSARVSGNTRTIEPPAVLWPTWISPTAAIIPTLLFLAFLAFAIRRSLQFGPGSRAADKIYRYGSLWLTLYASAWMLGMGLTVAALILGILALLGFVTMTILRELYGMAEQPVGYRR